MINSSSQKEKVYLFLTEQLRNGELQKKDKLSEQYFAEKLNISRTPVREALFQLAADGILEHTPRKGFKIKEITEKNREDIYELIGTLDGKSAFLAGPHLTESDFKHMQFLIETMNSAIKNELYTKYNELQREFHNVYQSKCQNDLIFENLEKYNRFFIDENYNINSSQIQEILYKTNSEHQKILDYFIAGDFITLREFIEKIHWRIEGAKYDTW
ncbi:GntR family transcriptional regulator [Vagococcus sp. DIV0080]|uniref:GntR family transcriptional regulator n=1 Tax=Candidatus Vagococcus giribetii TaxID=2230876 RepID=A0ABS3HR02_9ENTE|nr:GntR family transcriptional regulator [Vagococcus sp. DIV0080]MBO0476051.1 GntR family transcriptional regulator [Vagococcus sp. DIV0080]